MIIVKVGGGRGINIEGIVKDLAELDHKFIVVHGANAVRDEIAERLGKPKRVVTSVSGYASVFSDEAAMDAILMGYSGLKNKRIVELCQQNGINAIGLSGLAGERARVKGNKGLSIKKGEKVIIL